MGGDGPGVRRYAPIADTIHERRHSDTALEKLEHAVMSVLETQRKRAQTILGEQRGILVALRDLLLEKKILDRAAFGHLLSAKTTKSNEEKAEKAITNG